MPIKAQPVMYNGIRFQSKAQLAKALGISPQNLNKQIESGKLRVTSV